MSQEQLRALLPHLPLLAALAEHEHLTRAAEDVGTPQPVASRTLKTLSERLGGPITEPVGRGIRLTDAARALMPHIRIALRELEAGLDAWNDEQHRGSATVAVAFQNSLGERVIPELVREVGAVDSRIRFSLHQGPRQMCLDLLDAGQVDLAIVSDVETSGPEFLVSRLFAQPLVVAVPTAHRLASRTRVSIADLAGEPIVTMKPGFGLRRSVDRLFAASGHDPRLAFEGEDLRTIDGLVAAGLGVSIVPRDGRSPDGCVWVELSDPGAEREMAVVARTSHESAAIAVVIQVLVRSASAAVQPR